MNASSRGHPLSGEYPVLFRPARLREFRARYTSIATCVATVYAITTTRLQLLLLIYLTGPYVVIGAGLP